jgi:fatty acid desaturase
MKTTRDYSLTGPEAQRAIDRGLSQAEWYRSDIPRKEMKEFMKRKDGPGIRDTILWLGLMIVFATLAIRTWFSVWSILLFLSYGVLYGSASDSRWHEAGHGTAFKTRWMNSVVYQIASFMIMRNPTVWRWSHTRHHTDTIVVGRDPEIVMMRPPSIAKTASIYIGLFDVPAAMRTTVGHAFGKLSSAETTFIPETERKHVARVAQVWLAIYLGALIFCGVNRNLLPLLLVGPLPRMYGAWHHVLTGIIQHAGLYEDVIDHRLNTRTCYMNPVSRFIYWNMNYHVEHHMFPMVPYHALPKLHERLKGDLPVPSPSMLSAYRDILSALKKQVIDPTFSIDPKFPVTAVPVKTLQQIGSQNVTVG